MLYRKGKFYTRRGNEIDMPKKFYRALRGFGYEFDGELWLGYETTSSDITATTDFRDAMFMIFDIPDMEGPFSERYEELRSLDFCIENIQVVRQVGCRTEQFMEKYYQRVIARGGEGVVIRPCNHVYKYGVRDPLFQKKKLFETLEAIVVGYFNSAKGAKIKGYVSSLIVASVEDDTQFKVSFKSTSPPKEGSVVMVRYSQKTVNGLPKFPVFLGVRDEHDLPDEAIKAAMKRPRKYIITETVVDLDHPLCDGVVTQADGVREMDPGHHVYFDNGRGRKYKVTCDRSGETAYCSCEAWKYQHLPARFRTCKHCIMVYGYTPDVPWDVRERAEERKKRKREK